MFEMFEVRGLNLVENEKEIINGFYNVKEEE